MPSRTKRWTSWLRRRRFRPDLVAANAARDRQDWPSAAEGFARVLAADPANAAIWVQHGHALKEQGQLDAAAASYARAVALQPDDSDALLQHGRALKLVGRRRDAIAALADALRADPTNLSAYDELLRLSARDAIDDRVIAAAPAVNAAEIVSGARRTAEALLESARIAAYPRRNHDEFRRDFPIAAPPGGAAAFDEVLFLIDGEGPPPALLRSTLRSLTDQVAPRWRAIVIGTPALAAHPVGSFANVEPRITFATADEAIEMAGAASWIAAMAAGTILDPQALSWFTKALAETGATAAHADHDHGREHWHAAVERWDPAFYWSFDPDFLASAAELPAVVIARRDLLAVDAAKMIEEHGSDSLGLALLLAAGEQGCVAHVPRLLSTKLVLPALALEGKPDRPADPRPRWRPAEPPGGKQSIHVIIPTRDEADMLERCVATLIELSAMPERLRITIVDNRSTTDAMRAFLAEGAAAQRFAVTRFDEPFNWSRANNLAAAGSDADILLFLNNDTEMLTESWDELLRRRLAAPGTGALGARLVYPDGDVQHAGILFGRENGLPVHEAAGTAPDDPGPMRRSVTRRRVAAVTGAFLAIRRSDFEQFGGFDEARLFIAYNDVDLCFRLREQGLAILYEPGIELIHHESKSRGRASTHSQIAWDHAERETLYRLWGDTLFDEPSYNPHWPSRGAAFDGLREPTEAQIMAHIRRSAEPFPWRAARPDDPAARSAP